jgi:hypothetical protein
VNALQSPDREVGAVSISRRCAVVHAVPIRGTGGVLFDSRHGMKPDDA